MVSTAASYQKSIRDQLPEEARYECLLKIAAGGMATVYVGRLRGRHGFSRLVAIKRAHPHLVDDPELRRALIAEAKLASRLHHPNVCGVLDIDEPRDELLLVMDYVEGASLAQLVSIAQKRERPLPPAVVIRILLDVCAGLHTAHELRGDDGSPLHIVHRDVSPQNVLVGIDGLSRIADFGVAKWSEATHATATGVKGKFAYMAPEYIRDRRADRRADVFALGVILWEALTARRLFRAESEMETMMLVVEHKPAKVSEIDPNLPRELDDVVAKALAKDPEARYATAADLAHDLEAAARAAGLSPSQPAVTELLREFYGDVLDARKHVLRDLLKASGETTSGASAMLSGAIEDPPTQTAIGGTITLSDARTLARGEAPVPAIAIAPPAEPRPKRSLRPLVALAVVGAGAASLFGLLALLGREKEATDSSAGAAAAQPSAAAIAVENAPHEAPLSTAVASAVAAVDPPPPSAVASTEPSHPKPTRRGGPAGATSRPVEHKPPPPPAETSKPSRPGLGY